LAADVRVGSFSTGTSRNLVERFFNKIKQCRRVATRYDKLAANYLAFIQLASIRLWLRVNESAP
jgi:transposase